MRWSGDANAVAKRVEAAVGGAAPRRPAGMSSSGPWGAPAANPASPGAGPASTTSGADDEAVPYWLEARRPRRRASEEALAAGHAVRPEAGLRSINRTLETAKPRSPRKRGSRGSELQSSISRSLRARAVCVAPDPRFRGERDQVRFQSSCLHAIV